MMKNNIMELFSESKMGRGMQCSQAVLVLLCATTFVACSGSAPPVDDKPLKASPMPKKVMQKSAVTQPRANVSRVAKAVPVKNIDNKRQMYQRAWETQQAQAKARRELEAQRKRQAYEAEQQRKRQTYAAEQQRKRQAYEAEQQRTRQAYHHKWEAEQARKKAQQALERKRREYQQTKQQAQYQQQQAQKQAQYQRQHQQAQQQAQAQRQRQQSQYHPLRRVSRTATPTPRRAATRVSQRNGGQSIGNYHVARLTGVYSNNATVERFIDRMVRQHRFNREYLNGVFSRAQFRDDIAKIWTRYYGRKKGPKKPSSGKGGAGWTNYRGKFLTAGNIQKGKQFWNQYQSHLMRAQQRYGVPAEYIVGIIGVETRWGRIFGKHKILEALLTSALHVQHRQKFFMSELENFLLMTRSERMDPLTPKGSYAGAMGYGQFMPSSFRSYAVDFDGDGIRDLWNPVDAIGSVANYFAKHGWRTGEEVVVPATTTSKNYYSMPDGYKVKYSLSRLANKGIRPAVKTRAGGKVHLLALSVTGGRKEPWIGFKNFYVITRYNHSTYYAMAVHQLGQAVKKGVGAVYAQH